MDDDTADMSSPAANSERDGKPMGAAPCDNGCASAGKAHRVAARSKAVKKREGMDLGIAKGRFIGID